jgi:copper chaperone
MAETLKLEITGMTCDHCVRAVSDALKGVKGVEAAKVSLALGSAVVTGLGFDRSALLDAVREEGYEAAFASA